VKFDFKTAQFFYYIYKHYSFYGRADRDKRAIIIMVYNINKKGYILNNRGQIETISYRDYLQEFGSDETTTPRGVAPRLYVEGNAIMTWGVRGNNHAFYASFANKREAMTSIYEIWERNIDQECNVQRFYGTKKEMFQDLADVYEKETAVIKRYFRLQKFNLERAQQVKIKHDNRPSFTKEMMINFINQNKEIVLSSLKELDELKQAENKEIWQVKANSLIQKVSNNDFRALNWKEIYSLIRETANL
jgi:hypothetical protein